MRNYKTIQGDMFDSIAKTELGNERYLQLLLNANPNQINTIVFEANISLLIPELPPKVQELQAVPSWRKNKNN